MPCMAVSLSALPGCIGCLMLPMRAPLRPSRRMDSCSLPPSGLPVTKTLNLLPPATARWLPINLHLHSRWALLHSPGAYERRSIWTCSLAPAPLEGGHSSRFSMAWRKDIHGHPGPAQKQLHATASANRASSLSIAWVSLLRMLLGGPLSTRPGLPKDNIHSPTRASKDQGTYAGACASAITTGVGTCSTFPAIDQGIKAVDLSMNSTWR
jgi:hypothetical protein